MTHNFSGFSFTDRFANVISRLLIVLLAVASPALAACSGGDAKELTRARAQTLISQNAAFTQPRVLRLAFESYKNDDIFSFSKEPVDETREQADARVLSMFLKFNPQLAAAQHLGMIAVEPVFARETTKISPIDYPTWSYAVKIKPTGAGLTLAKEMSLPASETEIPLAVKKFVAVTGIVKLAENQAKTDFTWVWVPNRLGKALDASTDEFKALPEDLQKRLRGETRDNLHSMLEAWAGEQKLAGLFQRYDDGWRLVRFW